MARSTAPTYARVGIIGAVLGVLLTVFLFGIEIRVCARRGRLSYQWRIWWWGRKKEFDASPEDLGLKATGRTSGTRQVLYAVTFQGKRISYNGVRPKMEALRRLLVLGLEGHSFECTKHGEIRSVH